jgi:hypothetical protein
LPDTPGFLRAGIFFPAQGIAADEVAEDADQNIRTRGRFELLLLFFPAVNFQASRLNLGMRTINVLRQTGGFR